MSPATYNPAVSSLLPAPAISVIVRTIGSSVRLVEALESLASQTRRDFEVVVVDMSDGAQDAVLAPFYERLPALRHLALARMSRPKALNVGIAAASAPAIGILDDDNLYDPRQLEILLDGLASTAAAYVYTGVRHATYGPDGQFISMMEMGFPFVFEKVLMGNFIYATGSAFQKALWEQLGGYDERFDVFEDWDFIIRAAQVGRIAHLPFVAGESRKFTGVEGKSNFDREIETVRWCHAGIYWKHRRLYFDSRRRREFRITSARHCAHRQPVRTGLLALTVRGWRLELIADLAAWLMRGLRRTAVHSEVHA